MSPLGAVDCDFIQRFWWGFAAIVQVVLFYSPIPKSNRLSEAYVCTLWNLSIPNNKNNSVSAIHPFSLDGFTPINLEISRFLLSSILQAPRTHRGRRPGRRRRGSPAAASPGSACVAPALPSSSSSGVFPVVQRRGRAASDWEVRPGPAAGSSTAAHGNRTSRQHRQGVTRTRTRACTHARSGRVDGGQIGRAHV